MMKTFKNIIIAGIGTMAVVFVLSSCQKGFDAKSYAPKRPLPKFDGYANSKDIQPGALVAYWPFNGDLKDSLSSVVGVGTGTSFGDAVKGKGLIATGNSYVIVNTPDAVKSLTDFTISVWVKMPLNTGAAGIVSVSHTSNFWGNFDIFFDNGGNATTGQLKVHVFNNAGLADAPNNGSSNAWEGSYAVTNPWDKWTHIAVTYTGHYTDSTSVVKVYYNGASAGTNEVKGFAPLDWSKAGPMIFGTLQFQTTPSLTTGSGAQGWAAPVNGNIDQVRVYNTALTSSQIDGLYNLEKAGR
jgi:hypothetical protein